MNEKTNKSYAGFIPYKCRCEALGENKRRGGLYKSLTDIVRGDGIFTVKNAWRDKNVFLSVCGGNGDYVVTINGERVGAGTSPYTEFSVTNFIKFGEKNTVSVEDNENSEVYLTARPKCCVVNAFVRPVFEQGGGDSGAAFDVRLVFDGEKVPDGLFAELYDGDLRLLEKLPVSGDSVRLPVANPVLWNAENPYVYRILIASADECLSIKAALREISVADGFYTVNGTAVTLRHYLGEDLGFGEVNNVQSAKNLLSILKRKGINAISPSLFPFFRNLTDVVKEKGFYLLSVDSEIKNKTAPAPVEFKLVNGASGLVRIINNYDFTSLGDFDLNYRVTTQQETVTCGHIKAPDLAPLQSTVIKLDYNLPDISFFEYFLEIEIVSNKETDWHRQGFVLASASLRLPVVQSEPETYYSSEMADISVSESDEKILVSGTDGEDFVVSFDKNTGLPDMLYKDGNDYIKQITASKCTDVRVVREGGSFVSVSSTFDGGAAFFVVYGDGEIGCSVIGDIGLGLSLPEEFDCVAFFGKYPREDVYDRRIENGKIEALRYAVYYSDENRGLMLKAVEPFDVITSDSRFYFSSKEPAFSFVLRAINTDEEDIMREGRTLPGID